MMSTRIKINYIHLVFGLFFVLYTIYIRIILVRLPKDLHLYIENSLNITLLLITLFGLFLSIYVITNNLYLLLYKNTNKSTLSRVFLVIPAFINNALYEVYRVSELVVSEGYDQIANLAAKFYSIFGNKSERLFIFISFFMRAFIVSVFLVDIFYFFRLNYFYNVLILLLIPLGINLIFFILNDFSQNLDDIKSSLIITDLGIDKINNLPITNYRPSPGNENIDLKYCVEQYILCSKISGYLEVYNATLRYYSIRLNIIIYSLYFTGWLFILYKNFSLLV